MFNVGDLVMFRGVEHRPMTSMPVQFSSSSFPHGMFSPTTYSTKEEGSVWLWLGDNPRYESYMRERVKLATVMEHIRTGSHSVSVLYETPYMALSADGDVTGVEGFETFSLLFAVDA